MSGADDDRVDGIEMIPVGLPSQDDGGDEDPVTLRYLKVWPPGNDNRAWLTLICRYLRWGNENEEGTEIYCSSDTLLKHNDHAQLIEITKCIFQVDDDGIGFIEFDIRPYLEQEGTTVDSAEQILATLCKELAFFFYYRMKGQRVPPPWTDMKFNDDLTETRYVVTGTGHAKTTLPRAEQTRIFHLVELKNVPGIYEINFSCINVSTDSSGGDSMARECKLPPEFWGKGVDPEKVLRQCHIMEL